MESARHNQWPTSGHILTACGTAHIALLCHGQEKLGEAEAKYHNGRWQGRGRRTNLLVEKGCHRADKVVEV